MNPLDYLINIIPEKYRKYVLYGPSAFVMLASAGALGYDAAMTDFAWSPVMLWALTGANTVAAAIFATAYKNTPTPVSAV